MGNALILFFHLLFSGRFSTVDRQVISDVALVRKITGADGCSINVFSSRGSFPGRVEILCIHLLCVFRAVKTEMLIFFILAGTGNA